MSSDPEGVLMANHLNMVEIQTTLALRRVGHSNCQLPKLIGDAAAQRPRAAIKRSTGVAGSATAAGTPAISVGHRDPGVSGAVVAGGTPTNENTTTAPIDTEWERTAYHALLVRWLPYKPHGAWTSRIPRACDR
jgi:hypothetical protein